MISSYEPGSTPGLIDPIWQDQCSSIPNLEARAFCEKNGGTPGSGDDFAYLGLRVSGQIVLQNVHQVDQQNYTSCGESAFATAWNYQHPTWALEVATLEKVGEEIGAYFTSSHPGPGGYLGTSPSGMEKIGGFYANRYQVPQPAIGNIDLANGDAYAELQAKGLLTSQLLAGRPVIIEATDIIGNPSETQNDSHFIIITGMDFDTGRVTYNDPYTNLDTSGRQSGYAHTAAWDAVWASWSSNRDHNPGEAKYSGRGWYMVVY